MRTLYTNKRGKRLPSVTQVTGKNLGWNKDAIVAWAVKKMRQGVEPNTEKTEKAQVGNAVHKVIKILLENEQQINDYDPETVWRVARTAIFTIIHDVVDWRHQAVFNACMGFAAWYCAHPIVIIAIEEPLVANIFGGTPDLVCRDQHGNLIILDWKTGTYIYPEYALQLAAYGVAWRLNTGESPDFLLDVRLDTESPGWENHLLTDEGRWAAEHAFSHLLEVEAVRPMVENGMDLIDSWRS